MDVFARLLARLEPPVLRRHWDELVDEELRHVHAQFDELLAAYERLQGVRQAVASLEVDQTQQWRSPSAMASVDAAESKQQELMKIMARLESALTTASVGFSGTENGSSETVKAEPIEAAVAEVAPVTAKRRAPDQADGQSELESGQKKPKTLEDTKESMALGSNSETESEPEDNATQAPISSSSDAPPLPTSWDRQVFQAVKVAQRLVSAKIPPTVHELEGVVASVCLVLASVPAFDGDFRLLAHCKFINLFSLTIALFHNGQRNESFVPIAETMLRAIREAITRNPALAGLNKYFDDFAQIKKKMEQYEITGGYSLSSSSTRWEVLFEKVSDIGHRITTQSNRPTVDNVKAFLTAFDPVLTTVDVVPGVKLVQIANGRLVRSLKLLAGVFTRGKKVSELAPLAATAILMLEHAAGRGSVQRELLSYRDKLSELKLCMEGKLPRRPRMPKDNRKS